MLNIIGLIIWSRFCHFGKED